MIVCVRLTPNSTVLTFFQNLEDEPEVESFIVPDPPGYFAGEDMGDPFQPRSPEHMALWMIERLTERLGRALRRGLSSKVQKYVAQREVMVKLWFLR